MRVFLELLVYLGALDDVLAVALELHPLVEHLEVDDFLVGVHPSLDEVVLPVHQGQVVVELAEVELVMDFQNDDLPSFLSLLAGHHYEIVVQVVAFVQLQLIELKMLQN
jgi:hypothetical protein